MAISTIKRDEIGTPSRVKYRIVILGNLDMHEWSKGNWFAPVIFQMEIRLPLVVSVQPRCLPELGDFVQVFC